MSPGMLIGTPSLTSAHSTDDRQEADYRRHSGERPSPTQHHFKFSSLPSYIESLDESRGVSHEQQLRSRLIRHHSSNIPTSRQHHGLALGAAAVPVRAEQIAQQYHRSPTTLSLDALSVRLGGRTHSHWQQVLSPASETTTVRDMAPRGYFGASAIGEPASTSPADVVIASRSSRAWLTDHRSEPNASLPARRPYGGEIDAIADAPSAREVDRSALAGV